MKLTVVIVSCLLFAAVLADDDHKPPSKEEVKTILKEADVALQSIIKESDDSDVEPEESTDEKRSAAIWDWKQYEIEGKRSPGWEASARYGNGGWNVDVTYSGKKRSASPDWTVTWTSG